MVALAPDDPSSLRALVRHLHSVSAREINREDATPGRKVWFEYWDGLVDNARDYAWCSAQWFEERAPPEVFRMVTELKTDRVRVADSYEVEWDTGR